MKCKQPRAGFELSFLISFPMLRSITPDTGGGRGVMVIVVGNGHGDTSSNLV